MSSQWSKCCGLTRRSRVSPQKILTTGWQISFLLRVQTTLSLLSCFLPQFWCSFKWLFQWQRYCVTHWCQQHNYCLYSYQQQQIGLSDCHIPAYCGKITYILIIEHFQENYHGISCEANTFFSVYTYALKESVYQKNKFLSQATFWYTMTKCSIIIVKHAKEKT